MVPVRDAATTRDAIATRLYKSASNLWSEYMATRNPTRIVPHFWYVEEAKEAARFYVKIFPKSRIDKIWSLNDGATECVEFRLFGQPFFAMSAGKHDDFNDAVSFRVNCRTQAEVDRYWNAILKNGGKEKACGWINDKFGVRWQITPVVLMEMMADRDKKKAARVAAEMQRQVKFDIAKLKKAFRS
jgi:predicted 3-demethylubiquinone-9 3-methyltransferase (glyoxalase superfamily)